MTGEPLRSGDVEAEIDRMMASGGEARELAVQVERLQSELEDTNRGVVALVAELDDAVRQWQTTFDALGEGVCLVDESGSIVRANQALGRLAGVPAARLVGISPERALKGMFGDLGLDHWVADNAQTERRAMEAHSQGSWFEIRLYPVRDEADRAAGRVLIVADISERKYLEEEQRLKAGREQEANSLREHAARMAALEQAKSEFLKLASHELRGPMAVLKGYLAMIEDGSLGEVPATMRKVLPVLSAKAFEVDILIEQMLETARLEDSRLMLKRRESDLKQLVQTAVRTMQPLAEPMHHLRVEGTSRRVLVNVDPTRLVTILTNLLENAIKYSPAGGPVVARLSCSDGRATVAITDRGLGIAAEDIPRLFSRFGRLVTSENSHIPGTGLGLYLSRELARMHGGDITCTSVPGSGSTFTLSLPAAPG